MAINKSGPVVVTGIKEIDRKLKTLVPRLQKNVIRQAMRKGVKVITEEAKARAPVDTGKLRRAIKTRAAKGRRGAIGVETRIDSKDFEGGVFYPAIVEYGTSNAAPHPFMTPAYELKKDAARTIAVDGIAAGIEREASRG